MYEEKVKKMAEIPKKVADRAPDSVTERSQVTGVRQIGRRITAEG